MFIQANMSIECCETGKREDIEICESPDGAGVEIHRSCSDECDRLMVAVVVQDGNLRVLVWPQGQDEPLVHEMGEAT